MGQPFHNLLFMTDLNSANSSLGMLVIAVSALVTAIIYLYMDNKTERKENKADREKTIIEYQRLSQENTRAINNLTVVVTEVKNEMHELRLQRQ